MAVQCFRLAMLVATLAATAGSTLAQLPGPPAAPAVPSNADLTKLSIEQLMELPVLTVVTAAKREQKTTEAPAQATVVSADDVRAYGYRTLADILRSVPGFYVTNDRSYGYVGVRGFSRPGDFGGRVLLLLDGHRMNDSIYDTAAVLNDFIVDVDLIERVEVIRGPGSALYGNNAFFAVVNVFTKPAYRFQNGEVSAEAGTHDTYKGRLTFAARSSTGTEAVVSASALRSDGLPSTYLPEHDTPEEGDGVVHGQDEEEAESFFASLRRGGLALQAAAVGRDKNNPTGTYDTVFGEHVHTFDGRSFLEGRYESRLRENLQVLARLYYDRYEYLGEYPYGADDGSQQIVINRDESLSESVGGEAQFTWAMSPRQNLVFGAEYRFDNRQELRNYDADPRTDYLDFAREIHSYGLYLQDEYRPLQNLSVTAGVRYDHFDTFGGTLNPRLALVYSPVPPTVVKLLYGTAFRAPNGNELYYQDNGLSTKLSAGLEPEKISTYEIVWEQRLAPRWRGTVSGYWSSVSDLINLAEDPADGLLFYDNIDQVETRGLEVQIEGQLTLGLRGRASYTWSKTEDQATGKPLSNSPEHRAKLNLTAPIIRGRLLAGAEVQYLSERATVGGRTLDAIWLVNATLFTTRLKGAWDISLSVSNLLDTSYSDPALTPDTVEQYGRTLRLKVVGHF